MAFHHHEHLLLGKHSTSPMAKVAKTPSEKAYVIDMPIQALKWLNDWPVGLKLNTPLSQFFCSTFTLLIQRWGGPFFLPLFPRLFSLPR